MRGPPTGGPPATGSRPRRGSIPRYRARFAAAALGAALALSGCADPSGSPFAGATATVDIAGEELEFAATCHRTGPGRVLVIGQAERDDDGRPVRLLVHAAAADSYLGVAVGPRGRPDEVVEVSLDHVLDLSMRDRRIVASGLPLVRDLDLATGSGDELGTGSLEVECRTLNREVPDGFRVAVPRPATPAEQ